MARRLMLTIALLAPSSASEQHECTLDAATCTVVCAACATCTTPSFTYDLAAYATPASGWLVVDGATTTPAVGNGTSGTAAAQFYYAVCPSATTGQWLDPEQIRRGPAPPAPPPHQPHDEGDHPDHHYQGKSRWVGVVAEAPGNGSAACASSPCSLASAECAYLGRAEERTCTANGTSGLTCTYGGGGVSDGVARSVEFHFHCAEAVGAATARQADGLRFVIELPGPAGCGVPEYPPTPSPAASRDLSGGSLFCIALLVAMSAYVCGGVAYNHKVHDAPLGLEAVPHFELWRQLPGLVRDGCQLAYSQCRRVYEAVRDRNTDPALTRSLARSGGDAEPGDEMAAVLAL